MAAKKIISSKIQSNGTYFMNVMLSWTVLTLLVCLRIWEPYVVVLCWIQLIIQEVQKVKWYTTSQFKDPLTSIGVNFILLLVKTFDTNIDNIVNFVFIMKNSNALTNTKTINYLINIIR